MKATRSLMLFAVALAAGCAAPTGREALIDAYCNEAVEQGYFTDRGSCTKYALSCDDYLYGAFSVFAADDDTLRACAEAINAARSASPESPIALRELRLLPACRAASFANRGTLQLGENCATDDGKWCAAGSECVRDSPQSCFTCHARVRAGEACDPARSHILDCDWNEGLTCVRDVSDPQNGTCATALPQGAACIGDRDCESLHCDGEPVCVTASRAVDETDPASDGCDAGHFELLTCKAPPAPSALKEACGAGVMCKPGLYCDPTSETCKALAKLGEACVTLDVYADESNCVVGAACVEHVCVAVDRCSAGALGAACLDDFDCGAGIVCGHDSRCETPLAENEPCAWGYSRCGPNLLCLSEYESGFGTCQPYRPANSPCETSWECDSGVCEDVPGGDGYEGRCADPATLPVCE
jgi:hypothetical protein